MNRAVGYNRPPDQGVRGGHFRDACETEIHGTPFVLVETHLDFSPRENRTAQIAELVRDFAACPRVIISGDFNVDEAGDFAPFAKAGFQQANFGAFGAFPTHRRRKVELTPCIDNGSLKVEIELNELPQNGSLRLTAYFQGETIAKQETTVLGDRLVSTTLQLNGSRNPDGVQLWSPEHPSLYGFTARFGEDEIKGYFGMRKIEKRPDGKGAQRFYLNGEMLFFTAAYYRSPHLN